MYVQRSKQATRTHYPVPTSNNHINAMRKYNESIISGMVHNGRYRFPRSCSAGNYCWMLSYLKRYSQIEWLHSTRNHDSRNTRVMASIEKSLPPIRQHSAPQTPILSCILPHMPRIDVPGTFWTDPLKICAIHFAVCRSVICLTEYQPVNNVIADSQTIKIPNNNKANTVSSNPKVLEPRIDIMTRSRDCCDPSKLFSRFRVVPRKSTGSYRGD